MQNILFDATAVQPEPDLASEISYDPHRFQSVDVSLVGRYMLCDRREFECQIVKMSAGDAHLIAPEIGNIGDKVIAYIDHIGRIEGHLSAVVDGGFIINLISSVRKKDKLSAQLTWFANKDLLNLPEDRRHERQVPDIRHSCIKIADGREYRCKVIDISLSGAAIEIDVKPAMGNVVTVGRMRGRVVRHFDAGVAIEFASVQKLFSVVQANLRPA